MFISCFLTSGFIYITSEQTFLLEKTVGNIGKNSKASYEIWRLLECLKNCYIFSYSEREYYNSYPHILRFCIDFAIILSPNPVSPVWSLLFIYAKYSIPICPMRATYPTNIIHVNFMIQILFFEEYALWSK